MSVFFKKFASSLKLTVGDERTIQADYLPRGCREDEDDLSVESSPYPESLPAAVREYSLFPISFETATESKGEQEEKLWDRGGERSPSKIRAPEPPSDHDGPPPPDLD